MSPTWQAKINRLPQLKHSLHLEIHQKHTAACRSSRWLVSQTVWSTKQAHKSLCLRIYQVSRQPSTFHRRYTCQVHMKRHRISLKFKLLLTRKRNASRMNKSHNLMRKALEDERRVANRFVLQLLSSRIQDLRTLSSVEDSPFWATSTNKLKSFRLWPVILSHKRRPSKSSNPSF